MNPLLALVRREWLQHRRAWLLLALIPPLLAALLLAYGHIEFADDDRVPPAIALAALVVMFSALVMTALFLGSGLITVVGLARRDHGDRSVEFWLSLPVSHLRAIAVPMAVHLLLLPLAGAVLGAAIGFGLAALLVARVLGASALAEVPWHTVLQAAGVGLTRLALGWPMALLWLSPLVVLAMLAFAWARRWGLLAVVAAVLVSLTPLAGWIGLGWLPVVLGTLAQGALGSVVSGGGLRIGDDATPAQVAQGLDAAGRWLWPDVAASVQQLASPALAAALGVAALGVAGLVQWRRRGASAAV